MTPSSLPSLALSLALGWILIATVVTPVRAKALLNLHGKPRAEISLSSILSYAERLT